MGMGNHFTYQQGYHNARVLREEGRTTHRRLTDNTNECIRNNDDGRKAEQCYRLADCAQNYGLYDLLVYLYGDDIDFTSGEVDDEIVKFKDSVNLKDKVSELCDLLLSWWHSISSFSFLLFNSWTELHPRVRSSLISIT